MLLVVVRAAAVHSKIEVIDGRAEEELTHVVNAMRPRIGDAGRSPRYRPLDEAHLQAIEVGIEDGAVGLHVSARWIGPRSVVIDVGVVGTDQMFSANVLITDTQRAFFGE